MNKQTNLALNDRPPPFGVNHFDAAGFPERSEYFWLEREAAEFIQQRREAGCKAELMQPGDLGVKFSPTGIERMQA